MTTREKAELILIVFATGAVCIFRARLPAQWSPGNLVLCASVILLGQGLIRDLWIKYVVRKLPERGPRQAIRCMCMESTLGAGGVVAGLLLIFIRSSATLALPQWFWPALFSVVTVAGFLMKDLVIDFKTWTIRREKDHQNIVFW